MATAVKKRPASKKTTKRKIFHKSANSDLRSFKVTREKTPFMTYRITNQTVYWSILLILILLLSVWVVNIQISIYDILNSIRV